jgi:hypothetical protein
MCYFSPNLSRLVLRSPRVLYLWASRELPSGPTNSLTEAHFLTLLARDIDYVDISPFVGRIVAIDVFAEMRFPSRCGIFLPKRTEGSSNFMKPQKMMFSGVGRGVSWALATNAHSIFNGQPRFFT